MPCDEWKNTIWAEDHKVDKLREGIFESEEEAYSHYFNMLPMAGADSSVIAQDMVKEAIKTGMIKKSELEKARDAFKKHNSHETLLNYACELESENKRLKESK